MEKFLSIFTISLMMLNACTDKEGPIIPIQGDYVKYTVDIQELSGLCLNLDKSFLWGVGDPGTLERITFDGKSRKVLSRSFDMEGVTLDPETGDLYICCEPASVYKVVAPDYKVTKSALYVEEAKDYGNSGLEGISCYKDGMILVGSQTGANMWAYKLDGTKVWRKSLRSVAAGIKEIADIFYDSVKDRIWIIDSETQSIFLFNGDATEHLATYEVGFGGNCESICVDYDNSCVWIADDDSPSRLYKIEFIL